MKVIYECGYDGNECENYKVELDSEGNVIEKEFKCCLYFTNDGQVQCDRCYFSGKPWTRVVLK